MDNITNGKKKTWWRNTLYFTGIDSIYTSRWSVNLRPRFFIIVLSVIGFFIVSMLGAAKYSTTSSFCNSCHIMEPYFEAWSNSKHSHVACVKCHQGKHNGQLSIYSGKVEFLDFPKMPSPMYLAHVDCVGCHYGESEDAVKDGFNGMTFKVSDKACVKCHDANFEGIWNETKKELQGTLTELSEKIEDINTSLKSSLISETDRNEITKKLEKVELWHDFILKSRGGT